MRCLSIARLLPAILALAGTASCGPAEGQRLDIVAPAARQAPAVSADEYIRRAAAADLFEIQSGRLALEKSDREDIRALARLIVDDHTRATETLEEAAGRTPSAVTPPVRLDDAHQAKLQQLQSAEGAAFNDLYLNMQRQAHQEALALHRGYAAGGDNADLKIAAGQFASMVEKHLEEVERISGTRSAPPPRG